MAGIGEVAVVDRPDVQQARAFADELPGPAVAEIDDAVEGGGERLEFACHSEGASAAERLPVLPGTKAPLVVVDAGLLHLALDVFKERRGGLAGRTEVALGHAGADVLEMDLAGDGPVRLVGELAREGTAELPHADPSPAGLGHGGQPELATLGVLPLDERSDQTVQIAVGRLVLRLA